MLGFRKGRVGLFDVGNVWPLDSPGSSFHRKLAQAAPRLFHARASWPSTARGWAIPACPLPVAAPAPLVAVSALL